MGWDGAGGYTRQHNFSADASAGIKILALRMDTELDDFASAMTLAWARDGQNVPTQAIPMGGQRFINVGAATSVGNYMRVREFIENIPVFMQDVETSADRISVSAQYFTSVSANQAPGDGTKIIVRANSNKSSAVLYLNGHSANVEYQGGNRIGPALVSGGLYEFLFSSADTAWKLQNPDDGRTAAEIAAGVTPTNFQYEPGFVERQGALGDGSTVDDTAFTNTILANAHVRGYSAKTFVLSSGIDIPSSSDWRIIDLQGSIVRPDDNNGRFTSASLTATATSTVSSGASIGSRSVVVASATSMAVSQWARITESTDAWPAFWAKITSVSGTTLEFDRTLPCTYTGTINIDTYSSLRGKIRIKNIVFDGSNVTASPGNNGHAIRLLGFEHVIIENIELRNYNQTTGGFVVHCEDCVDVEISSVRVADSSIGGQINFLNIDRARSARFKDIVLHGGGFGMNAFRCEAAIFSGNILSGRRAMEDQESLGTDRSIRGLKSFACGYAQLIGNNISDYESPIKIERVHRFLVANNVVRNAALFTYDGSIALAVSSASAPVEPYGLICNNLLENIGGIGIGIDSGAASTTDVNVVVCNNVIKDVGRYAIYCANRKLIASGNKIENWNTSSTGSGENSAAIYYEAGITATGNTFENSDATDACFRANFVSGEEYCFRDNAVLTANPYFNGGLFIEYNDGTATILNGTTSIAVTHSLVRTPSQIEIDLQYATNPTNDPGPIYLSAISATQFTVACRNDPGASFNVHWKARIRQPFTA